MSDTSQGPGWWQASDGRYYPPESAPQPAHQWAPPRPDQWAPPGPPTSQRTNGLAVAALVLGCLFFFGITALVAVILGFVAISQIKAGNGSGRGMAIAGVVLGFVGLAMYAVIIVVAIFVGLPIQDAELRVEADADVCYVVVVTTGPNDRFTPETLCGTGTYEIGDAIQIDVAITKTSGEGEIEATLSDGDGDGVLRRTRPGQSTINLSL